MTPAMMKASLLVDGMKVGMDPHWIARKKNTQKFLQQTLLGYVEDGEESHEDA
jgi:hypothetical protein